MLMAEGTVGKDIYDVYFQLVDSITTEYSTEQTKDCQHCEMIMKYTKRVEGTRAHKNI
jgi:hypothetical protein